MEEHGDIDLKKNSHKLNANFVIETIYDSQQELIKKLKSPENPLEKTFFSKLFTDYIKELNNDNIYKIGYLLNLNFFQNYFKNIQLSPECMIINSFNAIKEIKKQDNSEEKWLLIRQLIRNFILNLINKSKINKEIYLQTLRLLVHELTFNVFLLKNNEICSEAFKLIEMIIKQIINFNSYKIETLDYISTMFKIISNFTLSNGSVRTEDSTDNFTERVYNTKNFLILLENISNYMNEINKEKDVKKKEDNNTTNSNNNVQPSFQLNKKYTDQLTTNILYKTLYEQYLIILDAIFINYDKNKIKQCLLSHQSEIDSSEITQIQQQLAKFQYPYEILFECVVIISKLFSQNKEEQTIELKKIQQKPFTVIENLCLQFNDFKDVKVINATLSYYFTSGNSNHEDFIEKFILYICYMSNNDRIIFDIIKSSLFNKEFETVNWNKKTNLVTLLFIYLALNEGKQPQSKEKLSFILSSADNLKDFGGVLASNIIKR